MQKVAEVWAGVVQAVEKGRRERVVLEHGKHKVQIANKVCLFTGK